MEKVLNANFIFWLFFTDSHGGFERRNQRRKPVEKYWVSTKLRHFLWHVFTCIFMTRLNFDSGFLHFAAADVVYLFSWATP